ncbi:hypothetical protein FOMPIDRAFT_1018802 [Fomitopsis schrenkii]|uniref:Uncharacterized protein n=1 Tax=Fomitopsis schrenkii TaxID=2126942 RepID=S8F4D0_FOMSC|nr:hypothetical protein FOMPIDRAFT_1018802 [Fomitopsis schrenkii]
MQVANQLVKSSQADRQNVRPDARPLRSQQDAPTQLPTQTTVAYNMLVPPPSTTPPFTPPSLHVLTPDQKAEKILDAVDRFTKDYPDYWGDPPSTPAKSNGRVNMQPEGHTPGDNGMDADDEDEEIICKKGVPRGPQDYTEFNIFREWLKEKRLPLKYVEGSLVPVPLAVIQAWENNTRPGPDPVRPMFDWTAPMSSNWNKEMVLLLGDAFLAEIRRAEHLPLTADMCPSTAAVRANLAKKMQKVQTDYKKFEGKPPIELECAKTKNAVETRHNVRRNRTLTRHQCIVRNNYTTNPTLWGQIEQVLEALSLGAMSSDHTDVDCRRSQKAVTRAYSPWRAKEIGDLMEALETYPSGRSTKGNRAYPRTFRYNQAVTSSRKPIPKLPVNFYDPHWFAGQHKAVVQELSVLKAVAIPTFMFHSSAA